MVSKFILYASVLCFTLSPDIASADNSTTDNQYQRNNQNTNNYTNSTYDYQTPKNIERLSVSDNMIEYGITSLPIGFRQYCRDNQNECYKNNLKHASQYDSMQPIYLVYDKDAYKELLTVNTIINNSIESVSDEENYQVIEHWTLPINNKGDCEDYVLLKKKQLISYGYPEETLLITVVKDENNEGHAILTVVTDIGDLILDNKFDDIKLWHETPYKFIKRQSQHSPIIWKSLKKYS